MYMTKLMLDPVLMKRTGVYDVHQALWKVFSDDPDRRRDFLYRRIDRNCFLTVSGREPVETSFLKHVELKKYNPELEKGERILFSLRFNPVVKRRDEKGRQRRIDVVQDRRLKLLEEGYALKDLPSRLDIAEEVGAQWIRKRRESLGFDLEYNEESHWPGLIVESYSQDRFMKGKGRKVTLSSMDVRGFATVTDPEKLKTALFEGVGCAKGFGFGLLLIRRP